MFYEQIKELKNNIYTKNKDQFVKKLGLPLALIDFWGHYGPTEDDFATFNNDINGEFDTFSLLSKDIFTCLIDSIDLLITGSWANAASLLRISLETIGIIDYGNSFDHFIKIGERYVVGLKKPVFKNDEVYRALSELDKKDLESGSSQGKRMKLWASLSKYASHASNERFQKNFSVLDGKQISAPGFRIIDDNNFPEWHVNSVNLVCAYYTNVSISFYSRTNFKYKNELEKIRNTFSQHFPTTKDPTTNNKKSPV